MNEVSSCEKYEPKIKKLTKANSLVINERVIYICKKDHTGKASKLFVAYDYETKIQLAFNKDKDILIEFLEKQDLKVLDDS